MSYEYLRILTVCIFYFGLTYSFGFFTKSTTLTILAVVLYTLANLYFQNETESTWLLYFSAEKISKILSFPLLAAVRQRGFAHRSRGVF